MGCISHICGCDTLLVARGIHQCYDFVVIHLLQVVADRISRFWILVFKLNFVVVVPKITAAHKNSTRIPQAHVSQSTIQTQTCKRITGRNNQQKGKKENKLF